VVDVVVMMKPNNNTISVDTVQTISILTCVRNGACERSWSGKWSEAGQKIE